MGKCPFCSSSIDEDVLLYGGSCPKCFGEIPGEEAATDPGEMVRAKQAASDQRRMAFKALIPVVLAVPAVFMIALVAVGFVVWNQDPVAEVMNFDDMEGFEFDTDAIVAVDPDAPPVEPDPQPIAANPTTGPRPGSEKPKPAADPGQIPDVQVKPKPGGFNFTSGPEIGIGREGAALSDPSAIQQMIRKVMGSRQGTLSQCYNKRLKTRGDLEGRWRAYFTVGKDGFPKNVRFKGLNMSDSELESCLAREVAKWKFSKLTKSQPVEKSWRFKK